MTTSPIDPSDEMPDADWLDQHGDETEEAVIVGDVEADPSDRLDQTLDVPDDDEDDYDRA